MMLYWGSTQYVLIKEQAHTPELGAYSSFGIMVIRRTVHGYQRLAGVQNVPVSRAFAAAM